MVSSAMIRVLIVDDIQETRENIRRMLQFEPRVEVVGGAQNGAEAIALAIETKPDVVIMDINMPDMDGISATEAIRKKVPYVQTIILSVQADPSYMRRAMLAGARDFLTKPPMIDELTAAVRHAGDVAHDEKNKTPAPFTTDAVHGMPGGNGSYPTKRGKIITVYSPKGGTGCTMVAANLALALQKHGPTMLVDASLQFGDIAVLLNEQVKNSILDLTSRADELDPEIINEVAGEHAPTGLRFLVCPPRAEFAEDVSSDQFSKLINYLASMYVYVVIDTASYLTDVVQAALEYSDHIILVTTQEIPCIKSCNLFLSLANETGLREKITFVMNRFDKRITITPEKIGESLKMPVEFIIPFEEKIVTNSINRGLPFVQENETYPISKTILSLAESFHEQAKPVEKTAERVLFGKNKGI
ncbi:MAG: AAA family ATPase [Bellilinea sp.]